MFIILVPFGNNQRWLKQSFFCLQNSLQSLLNLHDSCGVNNLHGIPGLMSALLSVLFAGIASKDVYGER